MNPVTVRAKECVAIAFSLCPYGVQRRISSFLSLHFFGGRGGGGGAVASWLVRSTPERAVRVRALAGDIVLCS